MNSTLPQKLLLFLLATERLHISEPLTLPQELIVEILLRLPVKSLLRFKCVCKSWFSLISDPHFAKLHFDSAARPTYVLLMSHDGSSIQSIDAEASLHDDSALSNLVLPRPPRAPVLNFRFLGCCHGFIAFDYDGGGDVMLWNPSNGVHMHIPYHSRIYVYKDKIVYGFGHASKDEGYLILAKMHDYYYYSDTYVAQEFNEIESKYFSLKTLSWNKLAQGIDFPEVNSGFGSFLNGALHWLTSDGRIVAFDLAEKSLSEIPMPDDLSLNMSMEDNSRITVMEECLCLSCFDTEREVVEIWIMREYKLQSSWTKTIDLSTHDIPVGNFFLPMCFTKSGGIIGSTEFGGLAKFNANGELLEHRIFDQRKGIHHGVYKESLLSLPNMTDMRKQETMQKEERPYIYIN